MNQRNRSAAAAFGLALALLPAACLSTLAQPTQAAPPADHIGHTRHLHRHNEPHPRTPDASRFTTSRTGVLLPLPHENDAFMFAVFGDRTGGPVEGVSVLADAVRDVNLLEPDFVFTVGDLVQGYNTTTEWMAQMREFKGIMDQLLCPWFPVAGNHDIYWRGPGRPAGEHEASYETHFGPLWYAFEHKNCWFIALYSDEGNPDTGEKAINKPASQKMSPAQLAWLQETLAKAKHADHVFLFLHHPRWIGGNYGDDWDRVHEVLKTAGNVTAVFAGHIHRMRYDGPKDGIEYVTLATTGGSQSARVPSAGMLHHFNLVTVRQRQVAMSTLAVGNVIDPRDLTPAMIADMLALHDLVPAFGPPAAVSTNAAAEAPLSVTIRNPVQRSIEVLAAMESRDSRWTFSPDHDHAVLPPGESREFRFQVSRPASGWDPAFRLPEITLDLDYLTEGARYPVPQRHLRVPLDLSLPQPPRPAHDLAATFQGQNALPVPSETLDLPNGPFTLECWFNADAFAERTGLIAKTEGSDYGLFVSDGKPSFFLFIGDRQLEITGAKSTLQTGRWHHIAGVYDGQEARLYLDGKHAGAAAHQGARRINALPLMIGADVDAQGQPVSHFKGQIDAVRLSTTDRYRGESFQPDRRATPDNRSRLVLNMDGLVGPWLFDESPQRAHVLTPKPIVLTPVSP